MVNAILRVIVAFVVWFVYFDQIVPKAGIPDPFGWLLGLVVILAGLFFVFDGPKLISKYE